MKSLFLSSCLLILFFGCSFPRYEELNKAGSIYLDRNELPPLLSKVSEKLVYKASINAFGNYLSGLMIFKMLESGETRVAMISELGFNVFDFGFKGDTFHLYFMLEPMKKSYIINTLKKDIMLLLMQNNKGKKADMLTDNKKSVQILKIEFDDYNNYYYFRNDGSKPFKMENSSLWLKNVSIDFYSWEDDAPDSLLLDHFDFDLSIKLKRVKEKGEDAD